MLAYASLHLRSWVCAFVCKAHANAGWSLQSDWRWQFRGRHCVDQHSEKTESEGEDNCLYPCFDLKLFQRNDRNETSVCEYWSSHRQQCQRPVCPTLALNVRRKLKIILLIPCLRIEGSLPKKLRDASDFSLFVRVWSSRCLRSSHVCKLIPEFMQLLYSMALLSVPKTSLVSELLRSNRSVGAPVPERKIKWFTLQQGENRAWPRETSTHSYHLLSQV